MKVRTRFAPSPTGLLHVGGVRTALFNYLFAKNKGGTFVLRMEDTDKARSRPEFENALMADMLWLGLKWDEGPGMSTGEYGPYRQSERGGLYKRLAEKLLERGLAYRCRCTKERLKKLSEEQAKAGAPPRYDGRCRELRGVPLETESVLRFIIPDKEVAFTDLVHGPLAFDKKAFGDFIIQTPHGEATYNFASAVDDGLMKISHVIRGDDHLSNTPRHILLMEAMGFTPPLYAHVPLVLGPDRKPLGKRDAGAGIKELREAGYLPEALLNAAARLGWAPGDDSITLTEMAASFSINKLSVSPSIFEPALLKGLNKKALSNMSTGEVIKLAHLQDLTEDKKILHTAVEAIAGTASTLRELETLVRPFLKGPVITPEAAALINTSDGRALLAALMEELDNGVHTYDDLIKKAREKTDFRGRALFMPLRCALTGAATGIELKKIFNILGAGEVSRRIKAALAISKA